MKTVKLYEVIRTETYQMSEEGTNFSLYPWGEDTDYYKGYDDGGEEYIIPEGFTVAKGGDEQIHFYDVKDRHCPLITKNGKPALVLDDTVLFLKKN